MNVAIIEDNDDIARLYAVNLESAGHRSWRADQHDLTTVADADAVILDLMMPDVDGADILEQLKADNPSRCVIVASARYEIPDQVRDLADVCLTKPLDLDKLLAALP